MSLRVRRTDHKLSSQSGPSLKSLRVTSTRSSTISSEMGPTRSHSMFSILNCCYLIIRKNIRMKIGFRKIADNQTFNGLFIIFSSLSFFLFYFFLSISSFQDFIFKKTKNSKVKLLKDRKVQICVLSES